MSALHGSWQYGISTCARTTQHHFIRYQYLGWTTQGDKTAGLLLRVDSWITERKEAAEPTPLHLGSQQLPFPSCVPAVALFWERTLVLSYLPIQVQAQAASAPSPTCLLTVSVLVCLEPGLPFRGVLVEPPPSMRAWRLPDLRKWPWARVSGALSSFVPFDSLVGLVSWPGWDSTSWPGSRVLVKVDAVARGRSCVGHLTLDCLFRLRIALSWALLILLRRWSNLVCSRSFSVAGAIFFFLFFNSCKVNGRNCYSTV